MRTNSAVIRIYVEKKEEYAAEVRNLTADVREALGISSVEKIRIVNRYNVEVEGADKKADKKACKKLIDDCLWTVFAEPQIDTVREELPEGYSRAFAVEYLPGQYDQRADAAGQCIALLASQNSELRPSVRSGKVYLLYGAVSDSETEAIKRYIINPVESWETALDNVETLAASQPESVPVLSGFSSADDGGLSAYLDKYSLAMDLNDLRFCRDYFAREGRDPTFTELKVLDTYWSDHCRHTTFSTELQNIDFRHSAAKNAYDRYLDIRQELYGAKTAAAAKSITLMDMATIAAKYMRKTGKLNRLDISDEINACTVKIDVELRDGDGDSAARKEPWLLLFKNETHNHPTEIEPFGGAATCIGGAIRDPLSGRGYVYQAMRLSGAADPRRPLSETIQGKLPQRKIVRTAAAGYSSYGNQIGLATGLVDEIYHEGYAAKRMEIGAVVAAVPEARVRRERPSEGDVIILLGGRTGRDGCGGATGSSKAHTEKSLLVCGAEVQKGNAPEERKIQRLFRSPDVTRMIKRCNDFGAGGVAVAIGEIADGVSVDLDKIPKKYEGLDGTELAISESQERMAVVVAEPDARRFIELAGSENIEATAVGVVTKEPRLVMRWRGEDIVNIPRGFISTNGAPKHQSPVVIEENLKGPLERIPNGFISGYLDLVSGLNVCSKRGLTELFDSTVGAGTILMPLGGSRQRTPIQAMAAKIPFADTDTASVMSWGFDPELSSLSPFDGAYTAVVSSVAKLAASGASLEQCYLTFQEYFGKPTDPARWGKPAAALLGAFSAQMDLGIAAIGGKDSMSGTFERLDVPPTLVSFAIAVSDAREIISPEFKKSGSKVVLLKPEYDENSYRPKAESFKKNLAKVNALIRSGAAVSAYAAAAGGAAEAVFKMCMGNGLGFTFDDGVTLEDLFSRGHGAFVLELSGGAVIDDGGAKLMGTTTDSGEIRLLNERISLGELEKAYDEPLENIFPTRAPDDGGSVRLAEWKPDARRAPRAPRLISLKPRVLIPAFSGTNCEYDSAAYAERYGVVPRIFVPRTQTPSDTRGSIREFAALLAESEILFIPGGFSYGDEPDGSGKFIANFLRNSYISDEITKLLERGGLALGICNGFQALIKLGLVPYGRITAPSADAPTITYNKIGRHQSRIVKTRVVSKLSPWLAETAEGEIFNMPVSCGEGRFVCSEGLFRELEANGQIATQYVGADGSPSMSTDVNPSGSFMAVEGLTSPDGRVFGKMGHTERSGKNLYKNIPGNPDMHLFQSAAKYLQGA